MGDGHVEFSNHQHWLSTQVVDKENGGDSHDKVDHTDNTRSQEGDRAALQTDLLEDSRRVVDDSVDTGPLLKSLRRSTEQKTVKQSLGGEESLVLEQGDLECDFVHTVSLLGGFDLDKTLSLERAELELDLGVLGRGGSQVSKGLEAFLLSACRSVAVLRHNA